MRRGFEFVPGARARTVVLRVSALARRARRAHDRDRREEAGPREGPTATAAAVKGGRDGRSGA